MLFNLDYSVTAENMCAPGGEDVVQIKQASYVHSAAYCGKIVGTGQEEEEEGRERMSEKTNTTNIE